MSRHLMNRSDYVIREKLKHGSKNKVAYYGSLFVDYAQ